MRNLEIPIAQSHCIESFGSSHPPGTSAIQATNDLSRWMRSFLWNRPIEIQIVVISSRLKWTEMKSAEMTRNEMKWSELKWMEMNCKEINWNEKKRNKLNWNKMKRDELKRNELKRNELNGREGKGNERNRTPNCHIKRAKPLTAIYFTIIVWVHKSYVEFFRIMSDRRGVIPKTSFTSSFELPFDLKK
jgi:hypothetical protein